MNIHFINQASCHYFAEAIFSSLSTTQKKVAILAVSLFSCLALAYYFYHFCNFKATVIDSETEASEALDDQILNNVLITELPDGRTKKVFSDGIVEVGQFKEEKLEGEGQRIFPADIIDIAEDENEIQPYPNGHKDIMWQKGVFKNGELHGKGEILFFDRRAYEGVFVNGLLIVGVKNYSKVEGSPIKSETGKFINDKLTGLGKVEFRDGKVERGTFEDGVLKTAEVPGDASAIFDKLAKDWSHFSENFKKNTPYQDGQKAKLQFWQENIKNIPEHIQIAILEAGKVPKDKDYITLFVKEVGKHLNRLDLTDLASFTEKELIEILNHCPKLQSLNLGTSKDSIERIELTDTALQHLPKCLKFLRIGGAHLITNAGIEHLKSLTSLESLMLGDCHQMTDAGLEHLKSLTSLQSLKIIRCEQITDAGLVHLKALTALRFLTLSAWDLTVCDGIPTKITDAGLEHLQSLTSLQSLSLIDLEKITGQGFAYLKPLTSLRYLNLHGCLQIDDVGLEHLKSIPSLQWLSLRDCCQITDGGLEYLKSLPLLHSLDLAFDNKITDKGLELLKSFNVLKFIRLDGIKKGNPNVTKEQIKRIKAMFDKLDYPILREIYPV